MTRIEISEGGEPWGWCEEVQEVRDDGHFVLRLVGFRARKKALEHLAAQRSNPEHTCTLREHRVRDYIEISDARIVRREKLGRDTVAIVRFESWRTVDPEAEVARTIERPVTAKAAHDRTGHNVAGEVLYADITALTRWQLCALAIEAITIAELDTAGEQRGAAVVATEQAELADLREARRLLRRAQSRWD